MLTDRNREIRYIDPSRAVDYRNNNDIQFNQAKDFIDVNGDLIKGPVLDIGSGDGKVTAYMAKKIGETTTGGDISEERVNLANDTYGNDQLIFVVCNAVRLEECPSISSKQYGSVVSFNTLHHVPKNMQLSVFIQTKKLLLTDGIALFLIPGRSPELHDSINEAARLDQWKMYFSDFDINNVRTYETPEYYKILCAQAGFYDCEVTSANEEGGKELDREGLKKFLAGWLPHLAHLKLKNASDMVQSKFLDDIVSLYFSKMKKSANDTVNPTITQNKVVAYASQVAFFSRNKQPFKEHQTCEAAVKMNFPH